MTASSPTEQPFGLNWYSPRDTQNQHSKTRVMEVLDDVAVNSEEADEGVGSFFPDCPEHSNHYIAHSTNVSTSHYQHGVTDRFPDWSPHLYWDVGE